MSKDNRKQMSRQAFFDFFNQFGPTSDIYTTVVLEELFKKLYDMPKSRCKQNNFKKNT